MSLNDSLAFFIASIAIVILVVAIVFTQKYIDRKNKEKKEIEEARAMFEQRIALKPKHMGARHTSGAAPVIFGEVDSNDGQE